MTSTKPPSLLKFMEQQIRRTKHDILWHIKRISENCDNLRLLSLQCHVLKGMNLPFIISHFTTMWNKKVEKIRTHAVLKSGSQLVKHR